MKKELEERYDKYKSKYKREHKFDEEIYNYFLERKRS